MLCMNTIEEEEKTELRLKRLSIMDSSLSAMKNLSIIYDKISSYNEKEPFDMYPPKIKQKKKKKPVKKLVKHNIDKN